MTDTWVELGSQLPWPVGCPSRAHFSRLLRREEPQVAHATDPINMLLCKTSPGIKAFCSAVRCP
eukprot:scaffold254142_cov27-Tisochrysis_lutea.AAC.1